MISENAHSLPLHHSSLLFDFFIYGSQNIIMTKPNRINRLYIYCPQSITFFLCPLKIDNQVIYPRRIVFVSVCTDVPREFTLCFGVLTQSDASHELCTHSFAVPYIKAIYTRSVINAFNFCCF